MCISVPTENVFALSFHYLELGEAFLKILNSLIFDDLHSCLIVALESSALTFSSMLLCLDVTLPGARPAIYPSQIHSWLAVHVFVVSYQHSAYKHV